ncbi:SubName: Full=Uncharacterized protein {ECO:0000313/EMBL:CCA70534.1} [Serendipita indica DSM 11827]|uniref:Uncharacterized protein n=1 Tax=Serendipita indica (strain DSM 11827) TaxID=1109443 RepID=G4TGU1_SERID|nr:SubName: Full=Uncharacterized protein {ECO:0000313/EMBL:CCA70534.1} [Serendipita indica DSM 11827]CCA70534.1 hypothetical protein PIIN_04471 [Serendipita indica DSM 11827]
MPSSSPSLYSSTVLIFLQFLWSTNAAVVSSTSSSSSPRRKPCTDENGHPIKKGLCNSTLTISLATSVPVILFFSLGILIFVKLRRKRAQEAMMNELGLESKASLPGTTTTTTPHPPSRTKVVKVKLPGLHIPPQMGTYPGPDSVTTPVSLHIRQ